MKKAFQALEQGSIANEQGNELVLVLWKGNGQQG